MTYNKSWIDEANEKIHIVDVLSKLNVYVPESILNGGNKKIHCPFGFYHSDGGISKAMRVYLSSNTVYCFSCSKRYSPVSLAAAGWDTSWINTAFRLLDDAGFKPKTIEERWMEAQIKPEVVIDTQALAEALKMYCSGLVTDWHSRQLDNVVAQKLNTCLSLLVSVTSQEDCDKWLTTCKKVMSRILEESHGLQKR